MATLLKQGGRNLAKFDSEFELKSLQIFGILEAKAWFKSNWMKLWNEILVVQL